MSDPVDPYQIIYLDGAVRAALCEGLTPRPNRIQVLEYVCVIERGLVRERRINGGSASFIHLAALFFLLDATGSPVEGRVDLMELRALYEARLARRLTDPLPWSNTSSWASVVRWLGPRLSPIALLGRLAE